VQKAKLTETELSAKLEAAKLNNARREAAHRLAEADEASFQQRETQAREKRREEGAARRVMEGERERNRIRKLGAMGGREWDEGKEELEGAAAGRGRGNQLRRGVHGGVGAVEGKGPTESRESGREDAGRGKDGRGGFEPGRGRGGRGRGRGNGSSRGGRGRGDGGDGARGPGERGTGLAGLGESDFPALATAKAKPTPTPTPTPTSKPKPKPTAEKATTLPAPVDALKSPLDPKASWADQVEATQAPT
jgi:hypothetical protein